MSMSAAHILASSKVARRSGTRPAPMARAVQPSGVSAGERVTARRWPRTALAGGVFQEVLVNV